MRRFTGVIKTDAVGSEVEYEFEVGNDATDEDIEFEARQAAFQYAEWYYQEVVDA